MALTVPMAKEIINKVIDKTEKSIAREANHLKELADDTTTLTAVGEMETAGEPLPADCPYASYLEWKTQLQKEIKSTEGSLERISIEKAELMAFNYFIQNAPEV